MRRAVIVGSGNLAEALARAIAGREELELVQIYGRNAERAETVARLASAAWTSDPEKLADADIYLIAVSDKAVGTVIESLPVSPQAAVVHTAGSVPLGALPAKYARRGVLYPLQTFTKGREADFSRIPLFIEASDEAFFGELETFAGILSRRVIPADSERRAKAHLAGVFACNFVNHMYAVGERIVRSAGLDFEVLKPLIGETAAKAIDAASPVDVQTGPAVRNDFTTKTLHEEMLSSDPLLKNSYSTISQSIWETSKKI